MRVILFFKLFLLSLAISLLSFAVLSYSLMETLKMLAVGTAVSIIVILVYPEIRGIKQGDKVSVVLNSAAPFFVGKMGEALSGGRKSNQIRVRFNNGDEAVGIIESYEGLISPPTIRVVYEERIRE